MKKSVYGLAAGIVFIAAIWFWFCDKGFSGGWVRVGHPARTCDYIINLENNLIKVYSGLGRRELRIDKSVKEPEGLLLDITVQDVILREKPNRPNTRRRVNYFEETYGKEMMETKGNVFQIRLKRLDNDRIELSTSEALIRGEWSRTTLQRY